MTADSPAELDRRATRDEMKRARQGFHQLLEHATAAELRRPSQGTRWTNEQLLFHMLFGYVIVRQLLVLARIFGRTRGRVSTVFARLLDTARTPFHLINYAGSCVGARIIPRSRMGGTLDRVIAALQRRLDPARRPSAPWHLRACASVSLPGQTACGVWSVP